MAYDTSSLNKPLPIPQDAALARNSAAAPTPEFEKPTQKSVGEKWWNALTYTGVGYVANLALSVVLWDFFITGRGKPVYHGIEKGTAGLLKGINVNPESAEKTAHSVAKYIFSPLGGHITMAGVKGGEDHARYLTHVLNKHLDPNYAYKDLNAGWSTPEDELPPLVNEPNRNSWAQVYLRRGIGWGAVIGAGVALRATGFEQPLERNTLKVFDKLVDATGSQKLKAMSQVPGGRFQRYAQLTALDAYLTVVTSIITAVTKNTFGHARDGIADEALSIDVPGITNDDPPNVPTKHFTDRHPKKAPIMAREDSKKYNNYQDLVAADPNPGGAVGLHS